MYTSIIAGLGHYVPDNVVTNDDLSKMMDTNDEWITERTGIKERRWIDQAIEKTIGFVQQGGQFDMSLQVTIPNEFEKIAPVNIGYTAGIETTRVAHQWISKGNEMDKILVISSHSKNTFEQTVYEGVNEQTGESIHLRLNTPIDVINYPVKFHDDLPDLQLKFDYDYNFLTIAQFGPRKNLPNTIKWFVEEFENEEVKNIHQHA